MTSLLKCGSKLSNTSRAKIMLLAMIFLMNPQGAISGKIPMRLLALIKIIIGFFFRSIAK